MQNITFYASADGALGECRDSLGAKKVDAPVFVIGVEYCLKLRLFKNKEDYTPFPISQLAQVVSWNWVMDDDFDSTSNYILIADHQNITVATVTEVIDGETRTFTEVSIPIPDTLTTEVVAYLGTAESKSTLNGELCGYNSSGDLVFLLQLKSFTVRNRITSVGNPTSISPEYLTASQVRALIAAGMVLQFSVDGSTSWHDTQATADRYFRMRSASVSTAEWSAAIALVVGPQGETGEDSYCYVAYASDNAGTGFSLTPTDALPYRAEIHVTEPIATPTITDFASATWVRYLGRDGTGAGDMLKSTYDPDDDGKVSSAATADSVPWSGVTDAPNVNPVRLSKAETDGSTLLIDTPVIYASAVNSSATLVLNFPTVKTSASGTAYTGQSGDFLTWEFHVRSSVDITLVMIGSGCTMKSVNLPTSLEKIGSGNTTHVFVVRGLYKSGAINSLQLYVNYAYSYEE